LSESTQDDNYYIFLITYFNSTVTLSSCCWQQVYRSATR